MKYVKIKSGYYGAREGSITKLKGKNDEPFPLSDEEADRIVGLGIAEYVGNTVWESNKKEAEKDVSEYDESTGMSDLKAIAKREGISVPFGISKNALKELLDEHFGADAEGLPDFEAENPVL